MLSVWYNTGFIPSEADLRTKYIDPILPFDPTKESLKDIEKKVNDQA